MLPRDFRVITIILHRASEGAWDVFGNGKTILRAAGGIFYDHPLLAVAFNSDIADGSQQQQATLIPIGGPSPTGLFNAFQVFHGTVCGVQGSLAAICGVRDAGCGKFVAISVWLSEVQFSQLYRLWPGPPISLCM